MPASRKRKASLVAVVGASAAALTTGIVATWEGKSNDPYRDIVNVATVCFGETNVPMRHYSDAECEAMLSDSLAGYAEGVLACTPNLRGRPYQLSAAVSLSYNIGTSAYCRSTVDRRFDAGRWREGCDAFLMWRFANGQEVRGLLNRRRAERKLCLEDVA